MRVIVVALLAGCGFDHGHVPPSDALPEDAAARVDTTTQPDAARVSIVIEAEAPSTSTPGATHTWTAQALQPGFTGSGYISALPDDHANCVVPSDVTCGPYNTYQVAVIVPGTYRVTVRHAATGTGADDSVFWYVGSSVYSGDLDPSATSSWTDDNTTPTVALATGAITFGLRMRETGVRIDSVRLDLQ